MVNFTRSYVLWQRARGHRTGSDFGHVGCHVIDREGRLGNDAGPPFTGLAGDPAKTESTLRAFLTEPHDPMPALSLSREEIEHLIAYIRSLAG